MEASQRGWRCRRAGGVGWTGARRRARGLRLQRGVPPPPPAAHAPCPSPLTGRHHIEADVFQHAHNVCGTVGGRVGMRRCDSAAAAGREGVLRAGLRSCTHARPAWPWSHFSPAPPCPPTGQQAGACPHILPRCVTNTQPTNPPTGQQAGAVHGVDQQHRVAAALVLPHLGKKNGEGQLVGCPAGGGRAAPTEQQQTATAAAAAAAALSSAAVPTSICV